MLCCTIQSSCNILNILGLSKIMASYIICCYVLCNILQCNYPQYTLSTIILMGCFALWQFYVPKFLPLPLAQAKNGDKQFWKQKIHVANGKVRIHSWWAMFLHFGGGVNYFWFSCSQCVLNMFSSYSLEVHKFQSHSWKNSQYHLNFIPYGLPKVQLSCL
jgi:hypothetical protein